MNGMFYRRVAIMLGLLAAACILTGMGARGDRGERTPSAQVHNEALAAQIGFDPEVLSLVQSIVPERLHRLSGYDESGYQVMASGMSVSVPEQDTERLLGLLRTQLASRGYMAFVIEMNEGIRTDRIGILKGTDPYDILRVMHTNGEQYDISNGDIIDRLKEWQKQYPFDIIGAENDWVEVEFRVLPADLKAFAQEVADFCPDAVEQDAGGIVGLSKDIKATRRLFLWWEQ